MQIGYQTFPSGKNYVFVREGNQRFFLRNIAFLRHASNPDEIVVVREWGSKSNKHACEPPKGQMEWKELAEAGVKPGQFLPTEDLVQYMKEGVLREIAEEAKLKPAEIKQLRYIPVSYKQRFPKAGPDAWFRYQFWEGVVHDLRPAQTRMRQLVAHPDWAAMLPADVSEKDAVLWWSMRDPKTRHWIRKEFSESMVQYYCNLVQKMKG